MAEGRHEVNLYVTFNPAPPKPRRRHPWREIFWIVLAAALIGTVSGSSVVFGVVAGIAVLLYILKNVNGQLTTRNNPRGTWGILGRSERRNCDPVY